MLRLWIYLITVVDSVQVVAILAAVVGVISLFILIGLVVGSKMSDNSVADKKDITEAAKIFRKIVISCAIIATAGALVPNSKELAAIYLIPKIVNNEQAQQLPDNLLKLVNDWAKEQSNKGGEE